VAKMKFCITLLMIVATMMTVASSLPPTKDQADLTTTETSATISPFNIMTAPEFPCPPGQQRDSNGKCRLFLQNL